MFATKLPGSGSVELRYILLFLVSVILTLWQHLGMTTRLEVVPDISSSFEPSVHSDRINGGISVTRVWTTNGTVSFDCDILHSDTFAFCGVSIPLVGPGSSGIDLSAYDAMEIVFDFESGATDTLLIYMMNSERTATGMEVIKSNLRPINPADGNNRFMLPTEQFYVPSWWLFQNSHTGTDMNPRIDNVRSLQVTTGDNTAERQVRVTIHNIVFHGKLVAAQDLYIGLLLAWGLLLLIKTFNFMRSMSRQHTETSRRNRELVELNRFLSIQKDQYETMAKHDKLTGAFNRAGVRDLLSDVMRDRIHSGKPCSLLMIDIDHFKRINDEHGHDIGDEALKKLTSFIGAHTRDKDAFARWGGEEFMLICPGTALQAATSLAEVLRKKVEAEELVQGLKLTCSIGVAELGDESIKQWFKRADEALYDAKSSGRNRVVSTD